MAPIEVNILHTYKGLWCYWSLDFFCFILILNALIKDYGEDWSLEFLCFLLILNALIKDYGGDWSLEFLCFILILNV
jgi:hypothetical protein